jgi:hypothetical protein
MEVDERIALSSASARSDGTHCAGFRLVVPSSRGVRFRRELPHDLKEF